MNNVYITAAGAYLPNEPVSNDEIEDILGRIGGRNSPAKKRVLKQNHIVQRYYALDKSGNPTHRNCDLAKEAINQALERSIIQHNRVDYLATATTLGDLFLPGFASMVQGETKISNCEVASFHGVCASSMAALKSAYTGIKAQDYTNAVVCGSEFASRHFRAPILENLKSWQEEKRIPLDADFMRFMLSDGAGALIVTDQPNPQGLSLQLNWIEQRSHADTMATCMYGGGRKSKDGTIDKTFAELHNYGEAVQEGLFTLRQDLSMLEHIVPFGVSHYLDLIESGKLQTDFSWFLCHYSSHIFKGQIENLLEKADATIPPEKWFTNLYQKGNTGAASMFIMLEELLYSGKLSAGEKILCQVPESGRFITSFMELTVVGEKSSISKPSSSPLTIITEKVDHTDLDQTKDKKELQASLIRQLFSVWVDFEKELNTVPIVKKIQNGTATLDDYKELLLNLRQQVMEGSRWISRAASNVMVDLFELRSLYIKHSMDEHRDYKMIEDNFIALGGTREEIENHPRNIGSEAFSAYMLNEASKENPFHLIGAVSIIEGIGGKLAAKWAQTIKSTLSLEDEAVSFMLYHGVNDENHLNEMNDAIEMLPLTANLVRQIVKAAKVTARLYRLQLEEIGNY